MGSAMLDRGLAFLAAKMQDAAPAKGTLTYRRPSGETIDLTGKAWVGRTKFVVSDSTKQARVIWSDRDYLVNVADLALSGSVIEPERGARFEETLAGGVLTVYEVEPYANEPEYRHSDPLRKMWRIHVKLVAPA